MSLTELKSFFDDKDLSKIKKIWSKPPSNKTDQRSLTPCVATEFYKLTKKRDYKKLKTRYLMIEDNILYCCKSETRSKIIGTLNLNLCRCEFQFLKFPEQVKEINTSELFGFKITRNGKSLEVYTEFEELFQQWRDRLTKRVFQITFHEEFKILKMIGRGTFAKVYLANQKDCGDRFAVKAFNKEHISKQFKGKDSLINEIKIMRTLDSDYCLRLYETYESTNSIYFVVDLLQGGEMLNQIKKEAKLTIKEVMTIMKGLIKALQHLHSRGIMHRDLKPENILMRTKSSKFDLVLADFGLATFVDDPNVLFKRCGTPGYVAPEIYFYDENGPLYGSKCDIFSAGVIFYLILTGKQPFNGTNCQDIMKANKLCKINFELEQLKTTNQDAVDLLKKMLKANPDERIDADQCLQHRFFHDKLESDLEVNIQENLGNYSVDYKKGLQNKQGNDPQDKSMLIKTNSQQLLTGNINTIDKLGSSDFATPKNHLNSSLKNSGNEKSKFSSYLSQESGGCSPRSNHKNDSELRSPKSRHADDLRKIVIKKNMQSSQIFCKEDIIISVSSPNSLKNKPKNHKDEEDDDYETGDQEISEEGTPSDSIHLGLKNMNFEEIIRHPGDTLIRKNRYTQ